MVNDASSMGMSGPGLPPRRNGRLDYERDRFGPRIGDSELAVVAAALSDWDRNAILGGGEIESVLVQRIRQA